ncbi:hypothetical protein [Vineibacter terrae]|uniref:hypothetical protein n=1 Tax=Vineibacter terrae TaxID=2586908 RepID=UPI002E35E239|nr:hypothetical protein [Vineibacter terrae]HEX2888827.1 hypothetical protein [Vineibacter terrae]
MTGDEQDGRNVFYTSPMTRTEITLAEILQSWTEDGARLHEDEATRAAIAEGIAQGGRGEFATETEVVEAYKRFRQ